MEQYNIDRRNPLFDSSYNAVDGNTGFEMSTGQHERGRQVGRYTSAVHSGQFGEESGIDNRGYVPEYEQKDYSRYHIRERQQKDLIADYDISDDSTEEVFIQNNDPDYYSQNGGFNDHGHHGKPSSPSGIQLSEPAYRSNYLSDQYNRRNITETRSRSNDEGEEFDIINDHLEYERYNAPEVQHHFRNDQLKKETDGLQRTKFRQWHNSDDFDNVKYNDQYDDSFSGALQEQHDINIFDGTTTVICRKKVPTDNIRGHHSDQGTISDEHSMNGLARLPSTVRERRRTLKQKKELLLQQRSTHDLVEIYRNEILQNPAIGQGTASWKQRRKLTWQRFQTQIKEVLYVLELWSSSFKTIEGRFGTAVMSYFRFIRWLLFFNLYISLVFIGLILIPHLVLHEQAIVYESETKNTSIQTVYENQAKNCSIEYTNFVLQYTQKEDVFSKILDFLQGTGWMEQTELFYGRYAHFYGYGNEKVYNMGLMYLVAMGATSLLCFLLLVRNSGKGLKQRVVDRSSELTQFANKVLTGWDYCIADSKAAKLRHKSLKLELESDLENQRIQWKKENRTTKDKLKILALRIAINTFALMILCVCMFLIYYANQQLIQLQQDISEVHAIVKFFVQYLPSLTITILNVIVPVVFTKIVLIEDYSPAIEIRMTLLRTVLLRLASLGVLMVSLYNQILNSDDTSQNSTEALCGNKKWNIHSNSTNDGSIKCWETFVGQQFYKLVLVDFLATVILVFIVEFPRRLIHDGLKDKIKIIELVGRPEFDLPKTVLDLVYSQTLCWMGLFFSPLIPLMTLVKCFLLFYVKKLTVLQNYVPPLRPYRTSRSSSLFIMVLLISFILSVIPVSYMIGNFQPSQSCGPFRVYTFYQRQIISCPFRSNSSHDDFVFFTTVRNFVESGMETWPDWLQCIIFYLGTTGFLVPAIGVLTFVICYYWMVSVGLRKTEDVIKEQIKLEGRDKRFVWLRIKETL